MTDFTLVDNDSSDEKQIQELRVKHALQYDREKTALKYYLIGRNYSKAIKALGYVERIEFRLKEEERFRKDRVTPSLHHQLRIALSVTQLCDLTPSQEESAIVAALLHDIMEDHTISQEELVAWFGNKTATIVWKLTKKFAGTHKSKEEYVRDLGMCQIASLVKGLDRLDNLSNMIGVFTISKMSQYTDEAESVFLPMLKTASKLYPEMMRTFTTVSQQMKRQIKITRQYITSYEKLDEENKILHTKCDQLEKQVGDYKEAVEVYLSDIDQLHKKTCEDVGFKIVQNMTRDQKKSLFCQISSLIKLNAQTNSKITVKDSSAILSGLSRIMAISTLDLQDFISEDLSPGTVVVNLDDNTSKTKEY